MTGRIVRPEDDAVAELEDLELLVQSRFPIIVIDTVEERQVHDVLARVTRRLGLPLFSWSVVQGLRRSDADAPVYDTLEPDKALANVAAMRAEGVYYFKDLERFLENPRVVRLLLDLVEPFARDRRALVLAGPGLQLPAVLRPFAARQTLELPDRDALKRIIADVVQALGNQRELSVTLGPGRLTAAAEALAGLTRFEAERMVTRATLEDNELGDKDIATLADMKRRRLADDGVLDVSTPGPETAELGGLGNLREWIGRRQLALSDDAVDFGLRAPRGVLLLGVQGCGKSAAAAMIAARWQVPLARLEVARLYDRYIGETEARLERALTAAERIAPCVLLIDEIEKALAGGDANVDGGLSQRVLGRLLGWLQERRAPVFVVATCNQALALPPELMRKGRFDEVFFVDLPSPGERAAIFATHLARRGRDPQMFDLMSLAAACTAFSGAEIEQAVLAGLQAAFAVKAELRTQHLLQEIAATRPLAVVRAEDVAALRAWASGRTVPASADDVAA